MTGAKSVRSCAEAQLVNALEYISDTIIRLDFEGGVHYATAAARALFGLQPAELIGTRLLSFVHPDDRVRLAQRWRMLRFGREQVPCVYRTRHKGGQFIWTEAAFQPLPNGDRGEPREMVGVLRDITWRVNADEILEGGEKLADMLIANVVDYAIYLLDVHGNVKSWNSGAQRIKGYQTQEIIGTNFAVFYTDEAVQAGEPQRSLELARSAGKFEGEGWRRRKDGTCFWASVVIAPVRDRSGALVGYAKVTRDVSQRRAEQAALDNAAAELRVGSERVKLATQGARIGIWEWDLAVGSNWWDTTMFALYGLDDRPSAPSYEEWTALVQLDDRERAAAALAAASAGSGAMTRSFASFGPTERCTISGPWARSLPVKTAPRSGWLGLIGTSPSCEHLPSSFARKKMPQCSRLGVTNSRGCGIVVVSRTGSMRIVDKMRRWLISTSMASRPSTTAAVMLPATRRCGASPGSSARPFVTATRRRE